jgi:outer membrane murein-binding lipoprotein Lpp
MLHGDKRWLILGAVLLAGVGLSACESAAERELRLAREAELKTLDVEELRKQLETVDKDPYAQSKTRTRNTGRFRND